MASEFQIARIYGIPIRLHISLLVLFPVFAFHFSAGMGEGWIAWGWGLAVAVLLFASVALHELGHSVVALSMGVRVKAISLLPIGGIAQLERMPRLPRQEFLLALAGPVVSVLLAGICWLGAYAVYFQLGWQNASHVLANLALINFWLALFNLIPSFPMDGGRIFRAMLTPWLGRLRATGVAAGIGKTLAVIFGVLGAYPPLNLPLVAIAFFVYITATAEYRQVQREENEISTVNREAALSENIVQVSPSPFENKGKESLVTLQTIRRRRQPPGD